MNEAELRREALALPPSLRTDFLDRTCADDARMRKRLEAQILQADDLDPPTDPGNTPESPEVVDWLTTSECASLSQSVSPLPPFLDHYQILEQIGQGGMGTIYRALDSRLHRQVAIKVLSLERTTPVARERFFREAEAASKIDHPNVVQILHIAPNHHPPYFVMRLIDGPSLQQVVEANGALEVLEIVRIGKEIALGLAAAHRHLLLHRDIKPANVLLDGPEKQVLLTDFGLAHHLDDPRLTSPGMVAGTPPYMSPEQARGDVLDDRSDLFSLGEVLYTLCTGHLPFRGGSTLAVLRMVCEDTPPPIRSINPAIPEWLVEIVDQLLEKNPANRFQSAEQVAHLLQQCHTQLLDGREPPLRRRKPVRMLAGLGPLAVLGLILVATFLFLAWDLAGGRAAPFGHQPNAPIPAKSQATEPLAADQLHWELIPPALRATLGDADQAAPLVVGVLGDPVRRPFGHFTAASYCGDATTLALGTRSGLVLVVDTISGAQQGLSFRAHRSEIRAMSCRPDGTRLASGGLSEDIAISDPAQKRVLSSFPAGGNVLGLFYLGERRLVGLVATRAEHTILKVWDPESGAELNASRTLTVRPQTLVYSPRKNLFAIGADEGQIYLIDGTSLKLVKAFHNHQGAVLSLAFSPDGGRLYSGGADRCIRTWDPQSGELAQIPTTATVISVACLNQMNEGALAVACSDGNLLVCEPESGKGLRQFRHLPERLKFILASPDGQTLVCAGGQGMLSFRDAATLSERDPFAGHRGPVFCVAFNRQETCLASAGADGVVALWDVGTAQLITHFNQLQAPATSLAFSPCGRYLAAGCQDEHIRVWEITQPRRQIAEMKSSGYRGAVQIRYSPDGHKLAYADGSGWVEIWSSTGELVRSWKAARDPILSVSFSPDGETLATTTRKNGLQLWHVASGNEWASLPEAQNVLRAEFSPTANAVAGIDPCGDVLLWSLAERQIIQRASPSFGALTDLAFCKEGRLLLGYSESSGSLWMADFQKTPGRCEELRAPILLSERLRRMALGSSGRYLALPRPDGVVLILRIPQDWLNSDNASERKNNG